MAQKNQGWDKVLELIYNHPSRAHSVREIAKKTGVPSSTVQRYLQRLKSEKMVSLENKSATSPYLKFKKSFFLIDKLYKSGLVDYLAQELNPENIIVFGSVRKGEYEKDSDVDIFIETAVKKELNLGLFERRISRKVQLFIESDINKLNPHLFNNVINGIKLYGSLKLK
jgi:predicted nucleotidyltransferase